MHDKKLICILIFTTVLYSMQPELSIFFSPLPSFPRATHRSLPECSVKTDQQEKPHISSNMGCVDPGEKQEATFLRWLLEFIQLVGHEIPYRAACSENAARGARWRLLQQARRFFVCVTLRAGRRGLRRKRHVSPIRNLPRLWRALSCSLLYK